MPFADACSGYHYIDQPVCQTKHNARSIYWTGPNLSQFYVILKQHIYYSIVLKNNLSNIYISERNISSQDLHSFMAVKMRERLKGKQFHLHKTAQNCKTKCHQISVTR